MDNFAEGVAGIVGTTVMMGVGVAAGMAAVRMVDRVGTQTTTRRKRRKKSRR